MAGRAGAPALRLVNTEVAPVHPVLRVVNTAADRPGPGAKEEPSRRASVIRSNAAASRLSDDDARAILAAQTERRLEGGRLAMLRPESRRELHKLATRIGLRPFDANLVIAVTQDRAQQGDAGPAATDPRLALIGKPVAPDLLGKEPQGSEAFVSAMAAVAMGLLMMSAMVYWVVG